MRSTHLPRNLVIVLFVLLGLTFLVGNILVFNGVLAATPTPVEVTEIAAPDTTGTPSPEVSATPQPTPVLPSADTTGILILGILVVSVILIGLLWGNRIRRK